MAVLEGIVQGRTLSEAGVDTSFLLEIAKNAELGIVFAKAREMSSYAMEEEAIGRLRAAAADAKVTSTQLRAIDLLVQQLRWSSVKRNPNVFSEKAAVSITVPIQINTSLDLGHGATAGTKEFPNIYEAVAQLPATVPLEQVPDLVGGAGPAADIQYGGTVLREQADSATEDGVGAPAPVERWESNGSRPRAVPPPPAAPQERPREEEGPREEPRPVVGEAARKRRRARPPAVAGSQRETEGART